MNKLLLTLLFGSIGGYTGYKIGYRVSKKKYENLANVEVESLKKHYSGLLDKGKDIQKPKSKLTTDRPIVKDNAPINETKGKKVLTGKDYGKQYRTGTDMERIPGNPSYSEITHLKKEEVDTTKPYIITSDEFQESELECVTLFYTVDKVLTDDDYNQINNIGIVGGHVILEQMGMYDSDCLYVRDEKNGIDYEILLEERTFNKLNPGVVGEN